MLILCATTRAEAPADRYTDIYRTAVEHDMNQFREGRRLKADGISAAYYAWLLGEKLDNPRYRDFALELYDRFLEKEVTFDFHYARPFGLLTLELHEAGELTGERRKRARLQARQRLEWFSEHPMVEAFFDCNIALADTLAVACLVRCFPDDPEIDAKEIRRAVAELGQRILDLGDLNENACNYSSLGLCFFLELAALEGWMDEVAGSEAFRNLFVRQREIISPTGQIPEFGDGYFEWNRPRLDFACLLEIATRLYDDASFLEAAQLAIPPAVRQVPDDQLFRGHMCLTLEPYEPTESAKWPEASMVLQRRLPQTPAPTVPDKLVLRSGREPGDAMIMMDLYAEGSHAHRNKKASIGYYETAGVPLFHNLGRRGTRTAQCGNSFWIWTDLDTFPGYPKEKQWNTMTVPATYCYPADEAGCYRIGRDLLFRNFPTRDLQYLRLDNLRLEGPAGTLLLDGFERARSWHSNVSQHPEVQLESSTDRTQGEASQQVNWHIFGQQYCTRLFEEEHLRNTTFDIADYNAVKFDYQYAGQHPRCNLRNLFRETRWMNLGNRALQCEVDRAEARQLGLDAWGAVDFSDYNGIGNKLRRRIVLTREGALVIMDTFTPGRRAGGWAGGQLWQLYSLGDRGADWFVSESDGAWPQPDGSTSDRRALVK
jgi:hypothetical protein